MTHDLEVRIVTDVANQPKPGTRTHTFRCSDELWAAAMAAAPELKTTVPAELQKALRNMVKRAERKRAEQEADGA